MQNSRKAQRSEEHPRHSQEQSLQQEPTILYIVRHTEVHNPDDILYGRMPRFGLSDLGRRQAEVTASALAEELVAAFYTSPRLRARQTTRILAEPHPGVPVHTTRLLDEVLTGWQGRPHGALHEINFDFYGNPVYERDESIDQVWARVDKFARRTRRRHAGQTVVGVTHGDLLAIARAGYLGKPLVIESLRLPNVYPGHGSILRLTFDPGLQGTYPSRVDYYDPNGTDPQYSSGWLVLERQT